MATSWTPVRLDDPAVIQAALEAQPLVAAKLATRPDLPSNIAPFLEARVASLDDLIAGLDITGVLLLQLARFHNGVSREAALAEAPGVDPRELDRAAANLVVSGLALILNGRLHVEPDIAANVTLDLPLFEDHLQGITSDRLLLACRLLGADGGTRKLDRASAVLGVLRDGDRVVEAVRECGPAAVELFQLVVERSTGPRTTSRRMVDGPPGALAVYDLLSGPDRYPSMMYRPSYGASPTRQRSPLDELSDRLIVGCERYGSYSIWLWADVKYGLDGRLVPDWPTTPNVTTRRFDGSSKVPAPSEVAASLDRLVEHLRSHPAEGKKTGDRRPPVRSWRSAAKPAQVDPGAAPMFGELAIRIGLAYAAQLPRTGRGRNVEYPVQWQPNPGRLAEFRRATAGSRWLQVVNAWLEPDSLTGAANQAAMLRRITLSLVASLPEGEGLLRSDLDAVARHRHLALRRTHDLNDVLAEMVALGLIPGSGPIGLTAAGRAASDGADAIDALMAGATTEFVLQPDHSVITPPDLSGDVAATLQRYAELESSGGAGVWRLSAKRLALASTQVTPEVVVDFFRRHSVAPVPDAVARFIADSMTSVSPVTVVAAASVVTADDPVVLADAVRVKAAKLTAVSPTVATSSLSATKVKEVLLGRGIVLAGGAASSPTGPTEPQPIHRSTGPASSLDDGAAAWVTQRDPNLVLTPPRPIPLAGSVASDVVSRMRPGRSRRPKT